MKPLKKVIILVACLALLLQLPCYSSYSLSSKISEIDESFDNYQSQCCEQETDYLTSLGASSLDALGYDVSLSELNTSSSQIVSLILSNDLSSLSTKITLNDTEDSVSVLQNAFVSSNQYDIVEWCYQSSIITEEEKISCYCDLFLQRAEYSSFCLTPIMSELSDYYFTNNSIPVELNQKLSKIIEAPTTNSPQSTNTRSIPENPPSTTDTLSYESENFIIYRHIDGYVNWDDIRDDEYYEMSRVAYFLEHAKDVYEDLDFVYNFDSEKIRVDLMDCTCSEYGDSDEYDNVSALTIHTSNETSSPSRIMIFEYSCYSDALARILAHELFHVFQISANRFCLWFSEAIAEWGSIKVLGRISSSLATYFVQNYQCSFSDQTAYSSVFYPLTLEQETDEYIISEILEYLGDEYTHNIDQYDLIDCIDEVLYDYETSFVDVYDAMIRKFININQYYGQYFNGSLPSLSTANKSNLRAEESDWTYQGFLPSLSNDFLTFYLPQHSATTIVDITITFSNNCDRKVRSFKKTGQTYTIYDTSSASSSIVHYKQIISNSALVGFAITNTDINDNLSYSISIKPTPIYSYSSDFTSSYYLYEGGISWYEFTAPHAGYFEFYTTDDEDIDTFGHLCSNYSTDSTLNNVSVLASNDDGGGSFNFKIRYFLEEDQTVYLRVSMLSPDECGTYNLTVKHSHVYTHSFSPVSPTQHSQNCACGNESSSLENHIWNTSGPRPVCSKCGYIGSNTNIEIQGNEGLGLN